MENSTNDSMDEEIVSLESQINESASSDEDSDLSFEDLGLDEQTLKAIEKKGFKTPSPIQKLAIPRLLSGESNMIARARTGTGKTAAFGLPIIQKLRNESGTVKALVLEPTRELAIQTCTELQSFSEGKSPRTCVLYGGASYSTQIKDLKRGTEIVVGTPGRIQDHLERKTLDISKIDYFILDEGDEMLDMGFIDDIEAIFEKANPSARILLFSATMPEPILKIAAKFMGDYEIVEEENVIDEPLLIDQKVWIIKENEKIDALIRLIDYADDFYGVVFTQTKSDADFVSRILDEKGYEVAALHGDIAQNQREKILTRFRSRKTRILVATDVAARGIDISGLSHVVNYSLPFDGATYVHRIGRTGRAGSQGVAITFVCPNETRKLGFLVRAIKKASKGDIKEEQVPEADVVIEKVRSRLFNDLKTKLGLNSLNLSEKTEESGENETASENAEAAASEKESSESEVSENGQEKASPINDSEPKAFTNETDTDAEEQLFKDEDFNHNANITNLIKVKPDFEKMASDLCRNHDSQDVLAAVLSVMYESKLDKSRYGKIQSHGNRADQTRLYVQLGRKDGYNAKALADWFSRLLHIPGHDVDGIDISTNFSLVSLPKEAAKKALSLAKANGKIPHMHVDTKEAGGFGGGDGGSRRSRSRNRDGFGGRERDSRRFGRSDRDREGGRREYGERNRERGREKGSRPNVHTQSQRSGNAGLYKKKSSGKAERF